MGWSIFNDLAIALATGTRFERRGLRRGDMGCLNSLYISINLPPKWLAVVDDVKNYNNNARKSSVPTAYLSVGPWQRGDHWRHHVQACSDGPSPASSGKPFLEPQQTTSCVSRALSLFCLQRCLMCLFLFPQVYRYFFSFT